MKMYKNWMNFTVFNVNALYFLLLSREFHVNNVNINVKYVNTWWRVYEGSVKGFMGFSHNGESIVSLAILGL